MFKNLSASAALAYGAAALLIGTSAASNTGHGYELGLARSETHALIFAAGSLGGALAQPLAFLAAHKSIKRREYMTAAVAFCFGLVCLAFASISALGFSSTARATMTAERTAQADTLDRQRAIFDAAKRELVSLDKPQRNRTAEKARIERREALQRRMAEISATMAAEKAPPVSDPQAASLAVYLGALGWPVKPEALAPWLALLFVGFIEIGSASSLIVAQALAKRAPAGAVAHEPNPLATTSTLAVATTPGALVDQALIESEQAPSKRQRRPALGHMVEVLRREGGTVAGTQDEIARAFGASKTSVHRALHEAQEQGVIRLETGRNGTKVRLS
mgnify:CR=1 FL=1